MSTNMTGIRWFSKIFVFWTKVASVLEGLSSGNEVQSGGRCGYRGALHINNIMH